MKNQFVKTKSSFVTLALVAVVTLFAFPCNSFASPVGHASSANKHSYVVGKGSFYHKVASDFGDYTGISGVITLPAPQIDPLRHNSAGKPLDGFSIYMGGNASGQEVDAGFSWEKNPVKGGEPMVWRPFARATRWLDSDTKMTWKPGDTVRISVSMVKDGQLKLTVVDVGIDHPRAYSRVFSAWRFRQTSTRQFKRVDAIDQCGREGRDTLPTNSTVLGAIWKETYLLRGMGANQVKVALNAVKHTEINQGDTNIRISQDDTQRKVGGENVDVFGSAQLLTKLLSTSNAQQSAPNRSHP